MDVADVVSSQAPSKYNSQIGDMVSRTGVVSWVSSWILLRWTLQHLPRILSLRVALDVPTIKSAAVAVLFALSGYAIWELAIYLSEVIVF